MRLHWALPCHLLGIAALRCASLRVPSDQRHAWWLEWRAELWHVRQACTPKRGISWPAEKEVAAFCRGAFADARCLQEQHSIGNAPRKVLLDSPTRCILLLLTILTIGYGTSLVLPATSAVLHAPHYRDSQEIVLIQQGISSTDSIPTISFAQFQTWRQRRQRLFSSFAFYRLTNRSFAGAPAYLPNATIAVASVNLFELLGQSLRLSASADRQLPSMPRVVLSYGLWSHDFGSDASVIGRVVHVGATSAVVSAVLPEGSWKLSGNVDAWLLVSDEKLATVAPGFVVGRLNSNGNYPHWSDSWQMAAPTPDGSSGDFQCVSMIERLHAPVDLCFFSILLACFSLPATTSLPLGEYRVTSRKLSGSVRLKRWSFLAGKIALLLPIVYFISLDLAHFRSGFDALTSEYIQLVSAFVICLFGLRWSLRDQRQRCPVCLGKLTHPARVGQPSRNFLAWNGTELVCLGGHGLLHVPEISTSWFSTQRWLYLDPSWDVLFSEPLASASYF